MKTNLSGSKKRKNIRSVRDKFNSTEADFYHMNQKTKCTGRGQGLYYLTILLVSVYLVWSQRSHWSWALTVVGSSWKEEVDRSNRVRMVDSLGRHSGVNASLKRSYAGSYFEKDVG